MTRTISPAALDERLGSDLSALLRARDVPLVRCTEITTLPSPTWPRGSFLLELADGSRLKGRRLHSAERAQTVARLVGILGDGFPRILARSGEALLLEWVEGESLASIGTLPDDVLRRAGHMLGRIHHTSIPESAAEEETGRSLVDKLERSLALLHRAQRLDAELVRRTLKMAAERCPERVAGGVVHRDFCAENIVLDRRGALFSVDNANLTVGPLDLDLARTWYRWPLHREDMSRFLTGYEEQRSAATFRSDFAFWAPFCLVMSAAARLEGLLPDGGVPIERLSSLIDSAAGDLGGSAGFPPALGERRT